MATLLIALLPVQIGWAQSGGALVITVDGIRDPLDMNIASWFEPIPPDYLAAAIEGMGIPNVDVKRFPWSGYSRDTHVAATDLQDFLFNAQKKANGRKLIVVSHSWGTVLTFLALKSLSTGRPAEQRVRPDLYITLSSPRGTPFAYSLSSKTVEEAVIAGYTDLMISRYDRDSADYCASCDVLARSWINYWAFGDLMSGPLFGPQSAGSRVDRSVDWPTPPQIHDFTSWLAYRHLRTVQTTNHWHDVTSLGAGNPDARILREYVRFEIERAMVGDPFTLTSLGVSPATGVPGQTSTFRVSYHDPGGEEPSRAEIVVDGISYTMTLDSGSPSNGVYRYGTNTLSEASHSYRFSFANAGDGERETATFIGPLVIAPGSDGTRRLSLTASPGQVQEQTCTVLTATLTNSSGQPVANETISFSTDFAGALHGFPPPGCSGANYQAGMTGSTDAQGQVRKYFKPANSGNAVIVASSGGVSRTFTLTVSGIPGENSGSVWLRSITDGSNYRVEAVLTKGGQPLFHKDVRLTTSHGAFWNNGSSRGSTFTDMTDGVGRIGNGTGIADRIELHLPDCPRHVVITFDYLEVGYRTASTFYCSTNPIGETLPLVPIQRLSAGSAIKTLAWGRDGGTLVAGVDTGASTGDHKLMAWRASDWVTRFTKSDLRHEPISSAVNADNSRIAIGESGGGVELFDFDGNRVGGPWDESSDVAGLDWVGSNLVAFVEGSGSSADDIKTDGVYWLSQAGSYSPILSFPTLETPRTSLRYGASRNLFAYGATDRDSDAVTVYLHDGSNPASYRPKVLFSNGLGLNDVDMSPTGDSVAVVGAFGGAYLINSTDLTTRQLIDTIQYDRVVFLGNSGLVACGDESSATLKIFDLGGQVVLNPVLPAAVGALAWNEPTRRLAVGLVNGEIIILGIDDRPPVATDIVVTPETVTRGTPVTLSATLADAESGIGAARMVVRDSSGMLVADRPMSIAAERYAATWNPAGTTDLAYFVGLEVEDASGNVLSFRSVRVIDFTPPPLVAPQLSAVVPSSPSTAILSWSDLSGNEQGFRLERSLDGSSWSVLATVGANILTASDGAASPGRLTYYRVAAFNNERVSPSNVVSTTFPQIPQDTLGPTITVTSHQYGQVVSSQLAVVQGTASDGGLGDNGVSGVMVNGVAIAGSTAAGGASAKWSASVALVAGENTIAVLARDGSNNVNGRLGSIALTFVPGAPTFADDPIAPAETRIRTIHITELRQRIAELRLRHNLPPIAWTDATLVAGQTTIRAVHLTELREALAAVYTAAGLTPPVYSQADVSGGITPIAANDIRELRAAVIVIW
jgi:hypothetical protein